MFIDRTIFKKHLEDGEEVAFTAHTHWTQFIIPFIRIAFFGAALPWLTYSMGFRSSLFSWLIGVWILLAAIRLFYDFIDWYSDAWLFTNKSIIIVVWHGVFSNTSQRVSYEDTEGIAFLIRGFWGTILRYGDVTLKTISGSAIVLNHAKQPKKIELALMEHQEKYMSKKEMNDASGLKQMLSQMVSHHLRQNK